MMMTWKFDMTRDDSHGEDTPQTGPADVPPTMVATPRAVAVALGRPEVPPPVASQHHWRKRLLIVSQRVGTLRGNQNTRPVEMDCQSVLSGKHQCSRIRWTWHRQRRSTLQRSEHKEIFSKAGHASCGQCLLSGKLRAKMPVRACPTKRRPIKFHPEDDASLNVTRRSDVRTVYVLWFRWERFPPPTGC